MMTKSSILLAAALPLTAAFAPSSLPGLKGLSRAPLAARSTRAPAARAGGIAMEWEKKVNCPDRRLMRRRQQSARHLMACRANAVA